MKVRNRSIGNGEIERLVLPDVRGSEAIDCLENLEVERLEVCCGQRGIGEDGEENSIIWEMRGIAGERIRLKERRNFHITADCAVV